MRTLALPKPAEPWSLTSLREKLIKIGAKVVSHGRSHGRFRSRVSYPSDISGSPASVRHPRSEPACMTRPGFRARSNSHSVAARNGCAKIPLAAGWAQEDEAILHFLLAIDRSALPGCRRQARVSSNLSSVVEVSEQSFRPEDDGELGSDALDVE